MTDETQERETPERPAGVGRVIGALLSPRVTFASIVEKPDWLLPLVLLMAIGFATVFSFGHRLGWTAIVTKQLASNSRFELLTTQQQAKAIARGAALAPTVAYLETTAGAVILMLVIAAIFLAAFNIVFGAKIRFRQSFSIATYGFLPQGIKGILALVVLWARPPEGIDLQNLVMSNAGVFLSSGAAPWLRVLASSIDVFSFWTIALLAIGFAAAGAREKVSTKAALVLVVALWLVYLIVAVGFTAALA